MAKKYKKHFKIIHRLDALTSGKHNVAIGAAALGAATDNHCNIAIGINSLSTSDGDGDNNVAIGNTAMGGGDVSGVSNDTNEDVVITPTSVDTALGGAMVVPFKSREENIDQKLALNEDVEVINVPLQGNSTPQTAISGPSKVGAGKVPKFPTLDYANNYVVVAESIFNVSAV